MTTKNIITLDLASTYGWAIWNDGKVYSGSNQIAGAHYVMGKRLQYFTDWLRENIEQHKIEVVVFEAPYVAHGNKGGGGIQTSQKTAQMLFYLAGATELIAAQTGCACYEMRPGEWRKSFLGKDNSGNRAQLKAMTIHHCRARGLDPKDDNEADALGLMEYTAFKFKQKLPWELGLLRDA